MTTNLFAGWIYPELEAYKKASTETMISVIIQTKEEANLKTLPPSAT